MPSRPTRPLVAALGSGFFSSLALSVLAQNATTDYATACASLASSNSTTFSSLNTTIFNATWYDDATDNVTALGTCTSSANISVPLCRVQFYVNTSDISALTAEMWLPSNYSGRMLGLGNGGIGGCECQKFNHKDVTEKLNRH